MKKKDLKQHKEKSTRVLRLLRSLGSRAQFLFSIFSLVVAFPFS